MGEVVHDGFNVVQLTDLGINLESIEDKIIVMMDRYKSGYECKTCDGNKVIVTKSVVKGGKDKEEICPECRGKGVILEIPEISKSLPTSGVIVSLGENTKWARHVREGNNLKLMALRLSPESWQYWKIEDLKEFYKEEEKTIKARLGARVIFSPHIGTLIPFKGNIRLKIMREYEPLAVMYGNDAAARDFMEYDQGFNG